LDWYHNYKKVEKWYDEYKKIKECLGAVRKIYNDCIKESRKLKAKCDCDSLEDQIEDETTRRELVKKCAQDLANGVAHCHQLFPNSGPIPIY
jgi:hypothetical protein